MLTNTRVLIAACKELNIDFEFLHPDRNFLKIKINSSSYFFLNSATPFNSHVHVKIIMDKGFTYQLLKHKVKMPRTASFLSPFCQEQYRKYENIEPIIEEINTKFAFPVIIKMNFGSQGKNIFLCQSLKQIEQSLEQIFNVKSKDYNHIAIAQEYIDILHEYRAIIFNHELLLVYEKNKNQAKFVGNLSPLYWEGAKAIHITDRKLLSKIENFVQPIFQELSINYTGVDIVIDKDGKLWLIELNSKPSYNSFVRDNGEKAIVEIFKKMLKSLH